MQPELMKGLYECRQGLDLKCDLKMKMLSTFLLSGGLTELTQTAVVFSKPKVAN